MGREGPFKVYRTLEEFRKNVVGYPGGTGKAFTCLKNAHDWLHQFKYCNKQLCSFKYDICSCSGCSSPTQKAAVLTTSSDAPGPITCPPMSAPEFQRDVTLLDPASQLGAEMPITILGSPKADSLTICGSNTSISPLYDRMEGVIPLGGGAKACAMVGSMNETSGSDSVSSVLRSRVKLNPNDASGVVSKYVPPPIQDYVVHFGGHLSDEQKQVLKIVDQGKSVFFTGSAGTGKSLTLRAITQMLRCKLSREELAVTASTGIAALNIGGETLHYFAAIGLGKKSLEESLDIVMRNDRARKRWKSLHTLIIDEISMVEGTLFDKLEAIARRVREKDAPFGGIQLVICGDFFQLPPVPDQYRGAPVAACFAFETAAWRHTIDVQMRLTQVFRQADYGFIDILNRMRLGKADADLVEKIRPLTREVEYKDGIEATQLYPRNAQVESANSRRLKALSGDTFSHTAADRGRWIEQEMEDVGGHEERITKLLDRYSIASRTVDLKGGAQVMLLKNLIPQQLVNGSLERVLGFSTAQAARDRGILSAKEILEKTLESQAESNCAKRQELQNLRIMSSADIPDIAWPIVEFTNAQRVLLTPLPFDMEDAFGDLEATRVQIPLKLAWAITVHKSQGQTIERLKIDFRGTFAPGQAYVAMSRATSMDTLQILNFDPTMVRANPGVLAWNRQLIAQEQMDSQDAIDSYYFHCRE